jgi:hypothetical protein
MLPAGYERARHPPLRPAAGRMLHAPAATGRGALLLTTLADRPRPASASAVASDAAPPAASGGGIGATRVLFANCQQLFEVAWPLRLCSRRH